MLWFDGLGLLATVLYTAMLLRLVGWWRALPPFRLPVSGEQPATAFSVLIAARNEAENIEACLRSIAAAVYPAAMLEVLVIDDHSEDATAQRIRAAAQAYPALRIRYLALADAPGTGAGKKAALRYGLTQARHRWVLTTDADCHVPPLWLRAFDAYIRRYQPVLVAGPVRLEPVEGLFSLWQSVEFAGLMVAGGASLGHSQLFCSAANMAYRRDLVSASGPGGEGPLREALASGDDVFLLHHLAKAYPRQIGFLKASEAMVRSSPQESLRAWWRQRLRWASKNRHYTHRPAQWGAAGVWLAMAWMLLRPLFFIWSGFSIAWGLGLLLKLVGEAALLWHATRWMAPRHGFGAVLWAQPLQTAYVTAVGLFAPRARFTWKGRSFGPAGSPSPASTKAG
jgi:cellulose synthase/poly-beta-1,6-N-acetylglucosamine synthase-like glycosyltransferase